MHPHDSTALTPFVMTSGSVEETEAFAQSLAVVLAGGDVLALRGEMGAGKTTFVRGLHRGLGCAGRTRSPSFTTLNVYPGEPPLHHFDLFRYDAVGPAFLDEFAPWLDGEGVVVIEWPERLGDDLSATRFDVTLEGEGSKRVLTVCAHGEGPVERLAAWRRTRGDVEAGP